MAALAYLLPPVTGLIAFLFAIDPRLRFHGLQSVALGAVWPVAIYAGSFVAPILTRIAFFGGAGVWLILLLSTAVGRDLAVPGIAGRFRDLVAYRPAPEEG
jgi:uncharacterized membrane protein